MPRTTVVLGKQVVPAKGTNITVIVTACSNFIGSNCYSQLPLLHTPGSLYGSGKIIFIIWINSQIIS